MSAEDGRKPLGGRGSAPNSAGELTALHRPPSWWGGAHCPPKNPTPLSAFGLDFRPFGFGLSPMKSPGHAFALRGIVSFVNWIMFLRRNS